MIDLSTLLDPLAWPRWLARDAERRKVVGPDDIALVEQAVREFPAAAFAEGLLPAPLPVERVEKLSRGDQRDTTEGAKVRHRVVAEPSTTRGWSLGRGVVISMAQIVVRPLFVPIAKGDAPAMRPDGTVVRAAISGWEPYPAPIEVELDGGRTLPLADYLVRALAEGRRR
ncbi:hypothetical protein [Actinokineospora sp. NBRC 105648]|uniref:hypothetical protein n=1 Tax=Actinokineospora sp. NBRC 105648 TaxID=3032206 RepID=UPI0024A1F277|nr:hypothetical protein [Actinokineospora sp. NBRC 105648]GLZ41850.1 hypothetical protein Acsp05_54740 [Actinokineospora sp. NBRC 105648]